MPTRMYLDPIAGVPPLRLNQFATYQPHEPDIQHPLITVRLALAMLPLPAHSFPSAHRKRWGWVIDALDEGTLTVLVLDRTDGTTFLAYLPGAGDLILPHNLLEQCGMVPDYIVLPFDEPAPSKLLLFDNYSGLSSCRDYVILGPICVNCQEVAHTTGHVCEQCRKELEAEEQALKHPFRQDAMESSYGE